MDRSFAGLYDGGNDDGGNDEGTGGFGGVAFMRIYGWHYTAKLIAEHENIRTSEAFEMKTIIIDGKEYKQIPEKLKGSCEGCDFEKLPFNMCEDIQCDTGNFILKEITKKSKNKVKFFRYHRPLDPKTGYAKSDQGVTFFVEKVSLNILL